MRGKKCGKSLAQPRKSSMTGFFIMVKKILRVTVYSVEGYELMNWEIGMEFSGEQVMKQGI